MNFPSKSVALSLLWLAAAGCGADDLAHHDGNAAGAGDNRGRAGAGPSGGSSGHGGTGTSAGGGGGLPAMNDCPSANEIVDPTALIDDFEDGDAYIAEVGGRNGGWWTAGDDTPGATLVPEPSDTSGNLAAPELLPEPRCGSHYAMRVTGQGFGDWGAALGMAFVFGERPNGESGAVPYDASGRAGIDFWARVGDTSTNRVRYQVSDMNSEPDGGVCKENGAVGEQCYDSFGTDLSGLDTAWRHYHIPFSSLSQRNFGVPAPAVVQTAMYQVTFNFMSADPFDFWVDDLSFY